MIAYGQVLYAPYIDIEDNWLKTAALYYEKINRIVPEQIIPKDSETLLKLNGELDLVRSLVPTSQHSIENDFLQYANCVLTKHEERIQLNKALDLDGWSVPIHAEKMTSHLIESLEKKGLATRSFENWYNLDALTGSTYMGFLAKKMAEERALPIVTSSKIFHHVLQSLNSTEEDISFKLGSIVIQGYCISNIKDVSIDRIVKFRSKYQDEQKEFYSLINSLSNDLSNVKSHEALIEILRYRKSTIDKAVENIEKAGSGIGLNFVKGTLSVIQKYRTGDFTGAISSGLDTIGVAINHTQNKDALTYVLALKNELNKESIAKQLVSGKLIL